MYGVQIIRKDEVIDNKKEGIRKCPLADMPRDDYDLCRWKLKVKIQFIRKGPAVI